jgi:adenine-specific DNA-methyltransferase
VDEAWGLAVLYNSDFYNEYFRALNGNTQVSATEIRSIPLPPLDLIIEIGKAARALRKPYEEFEPEVVHLLNNVV